MKTASIHSLIAAAILAAGVSLTATPYIHAADPDSMDPRDALSDSTMAPARVEVADLQKILADTPLNEGWNKVVTLSERQDQIWAQVTNGKITAWQVKTAEGKDLRTHVRDAENANNLRLTWEPETGPGRFLEAPANVIRP